MSTITRMSIKELELDLNNFRTVPQASEREAIEAFISIHPDWFFGILESLIDYGYLPTESIIVLQESGRCVVKEGNRRIASMKLIHGFLDPKNFSIPDNLLNKISLLPADWLQNNSEVPCTVYTPQESQIVDKIITLTHAKGEKAGRDDWNSVATARHKRDAEGGSEPGLDLLEKYLVNGQNLTDYNKKHWAGEYNLTVLNEALPKLYSRLNLTSSAQLFKDYPSISLRKELESLLYSIGNGVVGFTQLRSTSHDVLAEHGIPPLQATPVKNSATQPPRNTSGLAAASPPSSGPAATSSSSTPLIARKQKAVATNDPRIIKTLMKRFQPKGANREKIVTLANEIRKLRIDKTPIAFCLLVRSCFELSARAYCKANNITTVKKTNAGMKDMSLAEILTAVCKDLTKASTDPNLKKELHGAQTELTKPHGILSVTSMNQVVHGSSFTIVPSDLPVAFNNVFPLLDALNK